MKATDFCKFFEFTLYKETGYAETIFYEGEYNYRAVDAQGVFDDRLVTDVKDLTDEFDSMLPDYIENLIEEDGFEPDITKNYWEQALEWTENNKDYRDTSIHDVIACLVNPELIEDDTEEELYDRYNECHT